MTTNPRCDGCGVLLQTEDEQALGYVPSSALNREHILCKRCFQLRHYNKNVTVDVSSDDFLKMVSSIHDKKGIVVHLIDLFDVDGTLLKNIGRLVGDKKIYLVANKLDLLPKSTNQKKLTDWLYTVIKDEHIEVEDIALISAETGYGIEDLAMALETMRQQEDIYVVGVTNVGKSTFINQLIQRSTQMKDAITTSYFPGTTLDFIHIALDQRSAMIDTPGIVNEQQISHYVSKSDLKTIVPRKEVKARNYQLNDEQTLFLGGLARLDFVKGNRQSFVCYLANELPIHRTKLEKADDLYEKQVGKLLTPPDEESLAQLPPLVKRSFRISEPNTDIVFSGLGWITILDGDVTVDVHYPKGITVSLRKSF
ncbi:MAG TPA: ribosome biogenesis GTPase YqeH [Pseudogracilibacillus sp.]|nr:ribosome biogenesis GTPase YqeH [Pseudogracilibacillus sp.]